MDNYWQQLIGAQAERSNIIKQLEQVTDPSALQALSLVTILGNEEALSVMAVLITNQLELERYRQQYGKLIDINDLPTLPLHEQAKYLFTHHRPENANIALNLVLGYFYIHELKKTAESPERQFYNETDLAEACYQNHMPINFGAMVRTITLNLCSLSKIRGAHITSWYYPDLETAKKALPIFEQDGENNFRLTDFGMELAQKIITDAVETLMSGNPNIWRNGRTK